MASGHVYEISVQLVRDRDGHAPQEPRALRFEHVNHDDLFEIVARMRQSTGLEANAATTAAVGLKLLAEVMLREKRNPLFDALRSGMRDFIHGLKAMHLSTQVKRGSPG